MRVRSRLVSIEVFGRYEVLGRDLILYLGGGVILNYIEDRCSNIRPYSVFASTSIEFAEKVVNRVMGLVAVPLDEVYLAESGRCDLLPDYIGLYRFVALPLDCALALAEGEPVPIDAPELEEAAELMAYRGIIALERGFMRLVSDEVREAIMRQAKRIIEEEGRILEKACGGGLNG